MRLIKVFAVLTCINQNKTVLLPLKQILLFFCCLFTIQVHAQDSTALRLPTAYISAVSAKAEALRSKLDRKSQKALQAFQKEEARIARRLARLDSAKGAQLLDASRQRYTQLQQTPSGKQELTHYLPALDTLKTSLHFLAQHKDLLKDAKQGGGQLSSALAKINELEGGLARAASIQAYLKERRGALKEQLSGLPFGKELKKLHKQAYYYSARVHELKETLKNQRKLERKALELLSQSKPFQDFMRQHSRLAALFRLPGGGNNPPSAAALQGLQTRASVQQSLQDRFGADATAALRGNLQSAQGQLAALKDKAAQLGQGSFGAESEVEMPDFRPNAQRTKSFKDRLVLGTNLQSQKARFSFPITADVGLSLGYRLDDKSIIGVGTAYKLGLGTGWQHLKLTHQGVGLRSFVDYKLKGSLFISGGYEQNFRSAIRSLAQLGDQSAWQASGLIGLTKKYKVSKKLKGNMQLLWDFLSYQQVPRTQAVLFRVGYSLK